MTEYLSFYWGGGAPDYRLRENLRNWGEHLAQSNSQFKVVLWTDESSFNAIITDHFESIREVDGGIAQFKWLIRGQPIGINCFDPETSLREFEHLRKTYRMLLAQKIYPFASSIVRIAILRQVGGLYLDCDYEPNRRNRFARNTREIDTLLLQASSIGMYLPVLQDNLVENSMVMIRRKEALKDLLDRLDRRFATLGEAFEVNAKALRAFLDSPESKRINRSNFNEEFEGQFQAFTKRNAGAYRQATGKSFGSYEGDVQSPLSKGKSHMPIFPSSGMPRWNTTFNEIFSMTVDFYRGFLAKEKETLHRELFKTHILPFFNVSQETLPLYSWSDPGYSRLLKLEWAATTMARAFRRKKARSRQVPVTRYEYKGTVFAPNRRLELWQRKLIDQLIYEGDCQHVLPRPNLPLEPARFGKDIRARRLEIGVTTQINRIQILLGGCHFYRKGEAARDGIVVLICSGTGFPACDLVAKIIEGYLHSDFARHVRGVVYFDYRSFGLSRDPASPDEGYTPSEPYRTTPMTMYTDVTALLECMEMALKIPRHATLLHGYGIGSGPALQMATQFPDLAGLVLHDPVESLAVEARRFQAKDTPDSNLGFRNIEKILMNTPPVCITCGPSETRRWKQASALSKAMGRHRKAHTLAIHDGINLDTEAPFRKPDPSLQLPIPVNARAKLLEFLGQCRKKPRG